MTVRGANYPRRKNDDYRTEVWKPVVGYEAAYEVSNIGRVRSLKRIVRAPRGSVRTAKSVVLKTKTDDDGYLIVMLSDGPRKRTAAVHVLMMHAFIGPCPIGMQVSHLNGVPSHNQILNLIYGTAKENADDRDKHGRTCKGTKNGGGRKLTVKQVSTIKKSKLPQRRLAKRYGVSQGLINHIKVGRLWRDVE